MAGPSSSGAPNKRWSRPPDDIDIDSYQKYHKSGFDLMSKALNMDETSHTVEQKKRVLVFYVEAIRELQKGVDVITNLPKEWKLLEEDRYNRAQNMKEKMAGNLDLAKDRVKALSAELETNLETGKKSTLHSRPSAAGSKPRSSTFASQLASKVNAAAKIAPVAPIPRGTTQGLGVPRSSTGRSPSGGRGRSRAAASSPKKPSALPSGPPLPPTRQLSVPEPVTPKSQRKNLLALKGVDSAMAQIILDQVIDNCPGVTWDAIAGQESAKQALQENVVWPALRPEVFTGLRAPARGLLLFGPPGNGKTLLAKAVATESKQTFFNISASVLMSKWVGEGEKLVRALFICAKELQPSIIFIDEIDSLLSTRKENDHEVSRRMKTEFLIQFDGVGSTADDRILVMGATNFPQELDLAALRRFPKRIMIPMPDEEARIGMLKKLLHDHAHCLRDSDFDEIGDMTEGYSGSDLAALAKDAAMGPIREMDPQRFTTLVSKEIRPITLEDFGDATRRIRPSVPVSSLEALQAWASKYADMS